MEYQRTYVKNGPVELSRSIAVKLSGARPSQSTGVADARTKLVNAAMNSERKRMLSVATCSCQYTAGFDGIYRDQGRIRGHSSVQMTVILPLRTFA